MVCRAAQPDGHRSQTSTPEAVRAYEIRSFLFTLRRLDFGWRHLGGFVVVRTGAVVGRNLRRVGFCSTVTNGFCCVAE